MNRPNARRRTRQNKSENKSHKWHKYLYLLTCATCVSTGWIGAKYIASIEGVVQKGRGVDYSFTITNKTEPEGTEVEYVETDSNGKPIVVGTGETLSEYSADTPVTNSFYLPTKTTDAKIKFTVTYKSEVRLRFYIYTYHTKETPVESQAHFKSVEYSGVDVISNTPNNPDPAKMVVIDKAYSTAGNDVKGNIMLPATKDEKTFECTLTVEFGELTTDQYHYISVVPTIVQVD